MTVIALDIGGTFIKGGVYAGDGRALKTLTWPTDTERGGDAVMDTMLDCASHLVEEAAALAVEPDAIGIVVPGLVDEQAGIAVHAANLGWHKTPVARWAEEHLGLPVAFGSAVRAGGLAEHRLGAGRGSSGFGFVTLGTAIAAAVLLDGQPLSGALGLAGELGHMVVRPGGEICACGAYGCLQTVSSATAVGRRYARAAGREDVGADEVARLAAAGEERATRLWREAVDALADALVSFTLVLDLDRIALGGDLALAGETLLEPLREGMARRLVFRPAPQLVPSELGRRAGCVGAALLAHEQEREKRRLGVDRGVAPGTGSP
ncbi:ROK family protein [Streptomyces sp. NPDC002463]|uniref:ROK family protein n=1 Tax=Streptomyces sp. NPDC002463 TaxID=3364645 RepID=UPI00368EB7F9